MSVEDKFNCNSKRLCGAIKSLMCFSSMNDAMWIMAREKPIEFVEFVETHLIEIQAEFENHFKTTVIYPRFLRQNAKIDHAGMSYTNRIGFIKMIRALSNIEGKLGGSWCLAESKHFAETLPRDYRLFYFTNMEHAQSSRFTKHCLDLGIDVEWVLLDSTQGLINYDDHKGKDVY